MAGTVVSRGCPAHSGTVPFTTGQERELRALAQGQDGVVSRAQLRDMGISRAVVRSHMRGRRWRRVHPGVYATFTGPLPDPARVWAGLLYAGPDAVASHDTAEWLCGLRPDLPQQIDVCVPHGRRHHPSRPGVHVRQSRALSAKRHPAKTPPRTTVEDTVLDQIDVSRKDRHVIDLVLRACQQRLTTPRRLSAAARARNRLRRRALVMDLLSDVRDGVTTPLERCYVRDVERAHGLPRGTRNRAEGRRGRRRYRDVRYRRWRLVVELDGRAAHPEDERELDDIRDNEVLQRQEATLRYGWRSVITHRCMVAVQVGGLLEQGGWPGPLKACGPGCTIRADSATLDAAWAQN